MEVTTPAGDKGGNINSFKALLPSYLMFLLWAWKKFCIWLGKCNVLVLSEIIYLAVVMHAHPQTSEH